MTHNLWRMEVPLLEMDKTFRRDTFEEDQVLSFRYDKCTKGEREVKANI